MGYWFNDACDNNGIIISTRVRFARNIKEFPFPSRMDDDKKLELNKKIKSVIDNSDNKLLKELKFIYMSDIPEIERYSMVERHIISKDFASNPKNRSIIISNDESISVMIGEEDHIRIQVLKSGFDIDDTYKIAKEVDNAIISCLPIAYDERLGFLTECPTNLGTGLRVSVMMHLPLLEATGRISYLADSINKIGFTVRGMYGEGSKAVSSLYQISNQITLGITEQNAMDNLKSIVKQLIEKEKACLELIDMIKLEDKCMRSLAILKGARIISSEEMMEHLSNVLLGISSSIIKDNILPMKLFVEGQPSMLMSKYGDLTPNERDIKRAEMIREYLS